MSSYTLHDDDTTPTGRSRGRHHDSCDTRMVLPAMLFGILAFFLFVGGIPLVTLYLSNRPHTLYFRVPLCFNATANSFSLGINSVCGSSGTPLWNIDPPVSTSSTYALNVLLPIDSATGVPYHTSLTVTVQNGGAQTYSVGGNQSSSSSAPSTAVVPAGASVSALDPTAAGLCSVQACSYSLPQPMSLSVLAGQLPKFSSGFASVSLQRIVVSAPQELSPLAAFLVLSGAGGGSSKVLLFVGLGLLAAAAAASALCVTFSVFACCGCCECCEHCCGAFCGCIRAVAERCAECCQSTLKVCTTVGAVCAAVCELCNVH